MFVISAKHTKHVGLSGGLYFGAANDLAVASFFDGLMDDIRIYDEATMP